MQTAIDISQLDKAEVLAALYNASKQQGIGFFQQHGAMNMTVDQARKELEGGNDFDYLHGRVMKVHLGGDSFEPRLFDRDNGEGAAARALAGLKPVTPKA